MKNYQTAADICQDAHSKAPNIKTYYRNWVVALLRLEKYEEAERIIRELMKEEPENKSKKCNHIRKSRNAEQNISS